MKLKVTLYDVKTVEHGCSRCDHTHEARLEYAAWSHIFDGSMTQLAKEVSLDWAIFDPLEANLCVAEDLIEPLKSGLTILYKMKLEGEEDKVRKRLIKFTESYLKGCKGYPTAIPESEVIEP